MTLKKNRFFNIYKVVKLFVYNVLENERYYLNAIYNIIGLIVVITSSITIIFFLTPQAERIPPDLFSFLKSYEEFALIFFSIEYLLRFWVSSNFFEDYRQELNTHKSRIRALKKPILNKLRWMFKITSIIDLISILPIFRPLRIFRILLLLRLLKLFRYTYQLKFIFEALKENSYIYIVILLFMSLSILVSSFIVYVYESNAKNPEFSSLEDAIYWGIITAMTVGYGDIVPITYIGKFIASGLAILTVVLISTLTATFSATFVNRLLEFREGNVMVRDLENHIVICGYNETSEEILENIMNLKIDREKPVVFITNYDKKDLGIKLSEFIVYKKGDFVMEKNLLEVGIDRASDVIIVGEKFENLNDRNIDARTALTGMIVKTLNPTARLFIEVLLDEDAEIFKNRIKAKDVLIHGQLIGKIMFSSLLNPGATQLIETMIDRESGIKKIKLKEFGYVENFGELLKRAREKNLLPIGIERNKDVILNPDDQFNLEEKDHVFIIVPHT